MRIRFAAFAFFLTFLIPAMLQAAVTLTWEYQDSPGGTATAIEIHRKDPLAAAAAPTANYQMIGTVLPTAKTYRDDAVTDDGTTRVFCYKVRAINAAGASNFSNEACTLFAPKNLKVTVTITVP